MAKELPYFKFYVSDWISGDITLENFEIQGFFVNVCAYYWLKDCNLTLINLRKKFRSCDNMIDVLISSGIIKIESGQVIIKFMIEQLKSKEVQKIVNKENGKKGGRPPKLKTETKPIRFSFDNQNETESITETKPNTKPKHNQYKVKESKEDDDVEKSTTNSLLFTLSDFKNIQFGQDEFTRYALSQTKFTLERLTQLKSIFEAEQYGLSKLSWPNESDAKKHFIAWCKKQPSQHVKPLHLQRPQ